MDFDGSDTFIRLQVKSLLGCAVQSSVSTMCFDPRPTVADLDAVDVLMVMDLDGGDAGLLQGGRIGVREREAVPSSSSG